MAMALVGDTIKVVTPTYGDGTGIEEEANARARSEFLTALWGSWRYIGQEDAFFSAKLNLLLRGRAALQLSWAKDRTPDTLAPFRSPISVRSLNPLNVGYMAEDDLMRSVYHTYSEKIGKLAIRYPEIKNLEQIKGKKMNEVVKFTDFWHLDDSGTVWNCYLINDREFLRQPKKSTMPIIPMIIKTAAEIVIDDEMRVMALLDGVVQEWEQECMIQSMLATGLSQTFFKPIYVTDERGEPAPPLEQGANAINEVPPTFKFVEPPKVAPDFGNAIGLASQVTGRIQKSTFNDAMFGDGGSQRSGFAFSQMYSAGMGRVAAVSKALSTMMAQANALALCMVKKFSVGPTTTFAYDASSQNMIGHGLMPDQINDSYENHVVITATDTMPQDLQKVALAIQLVTAKIISPFTVRERLLPFPVPPDEEERILAAAALGDPNILQARIAAAYEKYYGIPLPQGEPDMQMTPPQQPQGPMGPGVQPGQAMPGMPALPPQMQGQMTPEDMGNADMPPLQFDMAMGQFDPRQALQ